MATVPLIPRKVLFGNPDTTNVQLSPDGAYISYLAPRDGVLNIWVAGRVNVADAKPLTVDTARGIRHYFWAYTNEHLLYLNDTNGDENFHLYSVQLETGQVRDLTPIDGVRAQPMDSSPRLPEQILVGLNDRTPEWFDVYRIDITTGLRTLVEENDGFAGYTADDDYRLVLGFKPTSDGGMSVCKQSIQDEWEPWDTILAEDVLSYKTVGLSNAGDTVYLKDCRGRNTSVVIARNLATRETRVIAENSWADAGEVVLHPTEKTVQAVEFTYERKQWLVLDPSITADFDYLSKVADGDFSIGSRTLDDRFWIVNSIVDNGPARFYLYDRTTTGATFLFTNRRAIEGLPLVKMRSAVIQARDGLDLVSYYSLPVGSDTNGDGVPDMPLSMVLIPHGGPWGRDSWGYNPRHQWLANRGYAVMCVNFRSSTGFGKAHVNAGDREWGGAIMEDQVDAVQWAIRTGIADPARVAVMGVSFGGYSTLAGLSFTPELFACGVDLVGPSNLVTLMCNAPPYWKPERELFARRIGDHRTADGVALLTKHSPLTHAHQICRPLLIGQGANDARVKQSESDQIVDLMQSKDIPVTYILYPDEGHGFVRPENNISFNAIAEAFLAKCLGGRCEPIGDDFANSSLRIIAGAEGVEGLADAVKELTE